MSFINIWEKVPITEDGDTHETVTVSVTLSKRDGDRDEFNSFEYDEWLAAAAYVIKLLDELEDGQALVITKDIL